MVMKKLINDPRNVVQELVEGFVLANEQSVYRHPEVNAVIRRGAPFKDKVGIVTGGGAGHEPLFLEYVGRGMADAEAHGQVFAAPSPTRPRKRSSAASWRISRTRAVTRSS